MRQTDHTLPDFVPLEEPPPDDLLFGYREYPLASPPPCLGPFPLPRFCDIIAVWSATFAMWAQGGSKTAVPWQVVQFGHLLRSASNPAQTCPYVQGKRINHIVLFETAATDGAGLELPFAAAASSGETVNEIIWKSRHGEAVLAVRTCEA